MRAQGSGEEEISAAKAQGGRSSAPRAAVRKLKEKYWSVLENVQIGPSRPFGYGRVLCFVFCPFSGCLCVCVCVILGVAARRALLTAPQINGPCFFSLDGLCECLFDGLC